MIGYDRILHSTNQNAGITTTSPRDAKHGQLQLLQHTLWTISKGDEKPDLPAEFLLPLPIHPELLLGNI